MTEFNRLAEMIIAGDAETVSVVKALLAEGLAASEILDNGLLPGEERPDVHSRSAALGADHAGVSGRS